MAKRVNLLTPHKQSLTEKVLFFVTTYMRHFLVLALFATNVVFFWRMQLDQKIIDLNDTKRGQEGILKQHKSIVEQAQKVAFVQKTVDTVLKTQDRNEKGLTIVLANFPASCSLSSFTKNETGFSIQGYTQSLLDLQLYVMALKDTKLFSDVQLNQISRKSDGVSFSMTIMQ